MVGLLGVKESIFGVFYIVNESTSKENGPWHVRWCLFRYFLDAVQVVFCVFDFTIDCSGLIDIYWQVLRVLISLRQFLLFTVVCEQYDVIFLFNPF